MSRLRVAESNGPRASRSDLDLLWQDLRGGTRTDRNGVGLSRVHVSAHHKLIGVATDPNATINLRPRELAGLESTAELPLSDIQDHVLIEVLAPAKDKVNNIDNNVHDLLEKFQKLAVVFHIRNVDNEVLLAPPFSSQGKAKQRDEHLRNEVTMCARDVM